MLLVPLSVGLAVVGDEDSDHVRSFGSESVERIASSRVNGGTGLAAALALAAGLAGSVQAAVMGRFGERVGSSRRSRGPLMLSRPTSRLFALLVARPGSRRPRTGVVGAEVALGRRRSSATFVVFTITVTTPQIGTTATIGLLVAGQLAMGAVIDRYGLFGFERIALTWPRALGIALLAAGAALTLKR